MGEQIVARRLFRTQAPQHTQRHRVSNFRGRLPSIGDRLLGLSLWSAKSLEEVVSAGRARLVIDIGPMVTGILY